MPKDDPNIQARVLCDVHNGHGNRFRALHITYPRIIMAEVNTHKMLSKCSASSRAIPISKQIEKVRNNPFIPAWVGKNQPGMVANEEVDEDTRRDFEFQWKAASISAIERAIVLEKMGIHKQISNRLLEPFLYVDTIISGTEWDNMLKLRAHKDAQPEFQILGYRMTDAILNSTPVLAADWTGPFMDRTEIYPMEDRKKIATARVARGSYDHFDGSSDPVKDIELHDRLLAAKHMSPFEMIVHPASKDFVCGNLRGFIQYRKTIRGECHQNVSLEGIMLDKPSWIV